MCKQPSSVSYCVMGEQLSTFLWLIKTNSGCTKCFFACDHIQIYVDFPQDSGGKKNLLHPPPHSRRPPPTSLLA